MAAYQFTIDTQRTPAGWKPMDATRFWQRIARCTHGGACETCCWPWQGATGTDGYGRLRYRFGPGDVEGFAHRVAWRLRTGQDFPPGTESCHTCDHRNCCNPAHIRADTHQVNLMERSQRGRSNAPRGEASTSAKLTEANIREIWYRHIVLGETQRMIAAAFQVTQVCIQHILTRKTWKHIAIPVFTGEQLSFFEVVIKFP